MIGIKDYVNKEVEIEISGKTYFSGILIDYGLDILVIFDGEKYVYLPIIHLRHIKERETLEPIQTPTENIPIQDMTNSTSYRKTLTNARGKFVEIFVTGNRSIHGYITSVLNDYIVFYSPVYKMMFISMHHLKWLTPYNDTMTPYTLSNKDLPVVPANIPLARSFDDQLKKYHDELIVFDLGDHANKIGVVKSIANNIVELVQADGKKIYWKLSHIKTVHFT